MRRRARPPRGSRPADRRGAAGRGRGHGAGPASRTPDAGADHELKRNPLETRVIHARGLRETSNKGRREKSGSIDKQLYNGDNLRAKTQWAHRRMVRREGRKILTAVGCVRLDLTTTDGPTWRPRGGLRTAPRWDLPGGYAARRWPSIGGKPQRYIGRRGQRRQKKGAVDLGGGAPWPLTPHPDGDRGPVVHPGDPEIWSPTRSRFSAPG